MKGQSGEAAGIDYASGSGGPAGTRGSAGGVRGVGEASVGNFTRLIDQYKSNKPPAPRGALSRDHQIGRAKYSYNTGTMLQANVYLYELTGDPVWLQRATALADSAARYFCGSGKFQDGYWFNAVLLRGFEDLLKFNNNPVYLKAFKRCVDESLENDVSPTGVMGAHKPQLLVNQAGMLEILARLARMGK